ncbi:hypothetical protein [Phenylobacterium sp.]|uniref:hypothetical protein n=1 Tax=Phenylobacterium sp. TaxID=1871053 RepID=UPI00301C190D
MSPEDWRRAAPALQAALDHAGATHTLDDVRGMVAAGEAQAWAGQAAWMVTTLENDPRDRRLMIWLAGGDFDELVNRLRPAAERWAKSAGCRRAVIAGRSGWERVLRSHGYAPLARLIAKEL